MSYRSERFNEAMHSLELTLTGCDISKAEILSDRGAGAERIFDAIDYDASEARAREEIEAEEFDQILKNAIVALIAAGLGHTVPTLLAIIRNVNNREESICELR